MPISEDTMGGTCFGANEDRDSDEEFVPSMGTTGIDKT